MNQTIEPGRHTGDALDFAKRIRTSGLKIDVVTTDPPWNLPGAGLFKDAAPYPLQTFDYIGKVLAELRMASRPGALCFMFAPSAAHFPDALDCLTKAGGWQWVRELVWDKSRWTTMGLGRPWKNAHEPIFLGSNGKPRKAVSVGVLPTIMSQRPRYTRTSKPSAIYESFLRNGSMPGELAVDPFCGLNPLADAADKTGRRWVANDLLGPAAIVAQAKQRDIGNSGKKGNVRSGGTKW